MTLAVEIKLLALQPEQNVGPLGTVIGKLGALRQGVPHPPQRHHTICNFQGDQDVLQDVHKGGS